MYTTENMIAQAPRNWKKSFRYFRISAVAGAAILMAGCGKSGGDTSHEIAVAAVGPMTGSAAERGKGLDRAVRMVVEEVHSAGGVNSTRVRRTIYDDGDQPSCARELVNAEDNRRFGWGLRV